MKRVFKYLLLLLLLVLSIGVLDLRQIGAIPTQLSGSFVYIVLISNMIWILWNVRKDFLQRGQTRMEKN